MKEKKCAEIVPSRRYDEGPKFLGGRIFLCFNNDGFLAVCVLTRNVFTCSGGGGGVVTAIVYTNKLRCAVYIRLNFYVTPLLRSVYIYIYTHTRGSETFVDSSFHVSPRLAIVFH